MRRLFVMLLAVTSMAVVAPAIVSTPAFAADTPCNVDAAWAGPYWWGSVSAYNQTGVIRVLAISENWTWGSYTYLWDYNNDSRQKWYMDCVGYDAGAGRNRWLMRYAYNTNNCLEAFPVGNHAVIEPCTTAYYNPDQDWRMVPAGGYTAFYNPDRNGCLDVANNGTANGTDVLVWSCHYGTNQQWY